MEAIAASCLLDWGFLVGDRSHVWLTEVFLHYSNTLCMGIKSTTSLTLPSAYLSGIRSMELPSFSALRSVELSFPEIRGAKSPEIFCNDKYKIPNYLSD